MKAHPAILLLTLATAAIAEEPASYAQFANGDRIAGKIDSLTTDMLVWKSPALVKPAQFDLKNLLELSLPGTLPKSEADHEATVTLTNGDVLRGQLASVTDQVVSIDTYFAGRLNLNRLNVRSLKIDARSSFVYHGPTGLDGWIQSETNPAWAYSGAAFRARSVGGIAKDGLLPEECSVTFDVAWKADALGLKIILFSKDPSDDTPASGYELSFQRGSIQLRNLGSPNFMGGAYAPVLLENDKASIEIRASSKTGKIALLINDRVIEVWNDQDPAKGRFGQCLHFISPNSQPLRISDIGVAIWDGQIDRLPDPRAGMLRRFGNMRGGINEEDGIPAPPPPKPEEGRMELANGDSMVGEVESIKDGIISVKSPLGDLKLPVSRLRTVALKKVDLETPIRRNGDVRASLPDGSSVVFRLDAVEGDVLKGSSQNFGTDDHFGTADFKIAAFSKIEFNIHNEEFQDKRSSSIW